MRTKISVILFLLTSIITAQDARQLVAEAIDATGGKQNFYNLGSATYDYEYRTPDGSTVLVGKETYLFDGEKSYAAYSQHSMTGPNGEKVVEGYDGNEAWVTIDGALSNTPEPNGVARFMRKTNYYWFAMNFKLLDDGVNHEYAGTKEIDGTTYDLVKVTFDGQVGDAQDTYVLFINQETKLIDQFLFTVMGMGVTEPLLMTYEYETIDGIKVGSKRRYTKANWDGETLSDDWTITNWTNITFGEEVDPGMFAKPE